MTTKQKPAHIIRLGKVKATIWANQNDKGVTRHNVTVCRIYNVGEKKWKESSSFGRDEIPLLTKVLDQAHTWMFEHRKDKADSESE